MIFYYSLNFYSLCLLGIFISSFVKFLFMYFCSFFSIIGVYSNNLLDIHYISLILIFCWMYMF